MIHAVILDREDNFPYWHDAAGSGIMLTMLYDTADIPCCDTIIISEELNGRPIEETLEDVRRVEGFRAIPAAAVTKDGSMAKQEQLLGCGFDDVICMPLCKKLMVRRINGLAAMLPYSLSDEAFSYESLIDIRDDGRKGAFSVNSADLSVIYRFLMRTLKRLGTNAQVLMMRLTCSGEESEDRKKQVMQILSDDIRRCLRRGDIASVCSDDQVIVLLVGADDEGGHLVANRIVSSFYGECDDGVFDIVYDIHEMKIEK